MASKRAKRSSNAVLDKYTVQEKVVPLIKVMKTKEPAVMAAALAVFKQVGNIADTDYLALEVLPILWNFSLGPLLNLQLFQEFMDLIKKLSAKIEIEQARKLRDLSSSNGAKDASKPQDLDSTNGFFATGGTENVGQNDFERLVLGKGTTNGSDMLGEVQSQVPKPGAPTFSWSSPPLTASQNGTMMSPQARTITPDQALSSFATLHPKANVNTMNSGLSSFTPIQPMMMQPQIATTSWSSISTQQPLRQSQPTYSMPPPVQPQPVTPFTAFSLPPPPTSPQRSGMQTQNSTSYFPAVQGGYKGRVPPVNQPGQQKTGLDKYESLI